MHSKFFFAFLYLQLTASGFAQKGYKIKGEIAGAKDSTKIYLDKNTISDAYAIDSIISSMVVFHLNERS